MFGVVSDASSENWPSESWTWALRIPCNFAFSFFRLRAVVRTQAQCRMGTWHTHTHHKIGLCRFPQDIFLYRKTQVIFSNVIPHTISVKIRGTSLGSNSQSSAWETVDQRTRLPRPQILKNAKSTAMWSRECAMSKNKTTSWFTPKTFCISKGWTRTISSRSQSL